MSTTPKTYGEAALDILFGLLLGTTAVTIGLVVAALLSL